MKNHRATHAAILGILLLIPAAPRSASAQGWPGYARDPQHSCLGSGPSQLPRRIRWSTPVDLAPQYTGGGDLLIHYGSPVITRVNTVILPVKTGATDGFRIEARNGATGALLWAMNTDYSLPPHNWTPTCGPTLTPKDRTLVAPAGGGTVLVRTFPDTASGVTSRIAFYGNDVYAQDPATLNANVKISTPITCDRLGNLYFGYVSTYPGLPSGLARISSAGVGTFASAVALSGDSTMTKVVTNCAPAFSNDGNTLYVAVNAASFGAGRLCRIDAATLARQSSVVLRDPRNTNPAPVPDDGSGTPTVGPDGDVYFGVLETSFPSNHARGWLLHYDATLAATKLPSAFGWDDTASIVPSTAVPRYTGSSSYLLLTKYNNYGSTGGDGVNKLALVDPNNSMADPITNATVMRAVITVNGPTRDPDFPGLTNAVREWCINSAAIDPVNRCAVVNSEDGHVYRWDFNTNTLSTGLQLAPPTGEAYTPTVIGPDGAVYAINNARLFSCVAN
ncbi:MAG: hypothetical protein U0800_20920 [Isosphaeraceae bacterium]